MSTGLVRVLEPKKSKRSRQQNIRLRVERIRKVKAEGLSKLIAESKSTESHVRGEQL
jgi:hypothetical protein